MQSMTVRLLAKGSGEKSSEVYPITSRFLEHESFRQKGHLGLDFAMENFTPLRSIQPGEVLKVVDYGNSNVGKAVFVKWHDGKVAIYGHMSKISVHQGDQVEVGSLLGYSGNSGHVVGTNGGFHLHFGLKTGEHGQFIDPAPYADAIQHMNQLDKLKHIAFQSHQLSPPAPQSSIPDLSAHPIHITDILKEQANIFQEILSQFKLQFVDLLVSVDYPIFVQYVKNLFQFLT
jgi:hypothetical protein